MKKVLPFILALFCHATIVAQWNEITYFGSAVHDLKTFDDTLFMVGNFTTNEGNSCYWSAQYDGTNIIKQTNMLGGSGLVKLTEFNGELYGVGAINHGSSIGVSVWQNSTWENGGSTNKSHSVIYADGNDLYVGDDFGLIRVKTGTGSFSTFIDLGSSNDVSCISSYNGDLIVAGGFTSIGGTSAKNIAIWDGSKWIAMGTGINGSINSMHEYKGELYVAGDIIDAGGVAVSQIAKWDGSNWSDVGGGVTGTSFNGLNDMITFNNELWVVGDFDEMGNVSARHVASWNGTKWTDRGVSSNATFVESIEVYQNSVYIGEFDFDTARVYRFGAKTGINDLNVHKYFRIYPNPVNDVLNLKLKDNHINSPRIDVIDVTGKVHLQQNLSSNTAGLNLVNCEGLKPGIYILLLWDDANVVQRERFVVE